MSRFYGEIECSSSKTIAKKKGINDLKAHIRSYGRGVIVECETDGLVNTIKVFSTGGSNDPQKKEQLAEWEFFE